MLHKNTASFYIKFIKCFQIFYIIFMLILICIYKCIFYTVQNNSIGKTSFESVIIIKKFNSSKHLCVSHTYTYNSFFIFIYIYMHTRKSLMIEYMLRGNEKRKSEKFVYKRVDKSRYCIKK